MLAFTVLGGPHDAGGDQPRQAVVLAGDGLRAVLDRASDNDLSGIKRVRKIRYCLVGLRQCAAVDRHALDDLAGGKVKRTVRGARLFEAAQSVVAVDIAAFGRGEGRHGAGGRDGNSQKGEAKTGHGHNVAEDWGKARACCAVSLLIGQPRKSILTQRTVLTLAFLGGAFDAGRDEPIISSAGIRRMFDRTFDYDLSCIN